MNKDLQEKGIEASNQDFSQFEQVNKPQSYQLTEHQGEEEFDTDYVIPTCDMEQYFNGGEAGRKAFSQQLGSALEGIGFAILTGHGIDQALYESCNEKVRQCFETTSIEDRLAFEAQRHGSVNQGYFPVRKTTIIHPDLVEGWVFCRRAFGLADNADFDESTFWPGAGYEPVFRQLVQAQEKLILPVMQSMLRYLGCEPHLYDDRLTDTNFGFRLNYYPSVSASDRASGAGRMLGHEDVDLFTFLPAPDVDGLQVLNRNNMKWIRLNAPPGSIILNTGDYMQRLSNDIFPSTTHRVSHPVNPELLNRPRISFPMAIYLWEDEILEVVPGTGEPKYPPVSALQFHTAITSKYYGADYAVDQQSSEND
jgi:isopenicillin N synthase-like dioxygenase